NVMVLSSGALKVLDFGLCDAAHWSSVTRTGATLGTVGYMAPEVFEGTMTAQSDQYSLGVMAYEMLSGSKLFEFSVTMATVMAHPTNPPPPLTTVRPDLPAAVGTIISRTLEKRPDDRFPAVAALADALRDAAQA